MANWFDRKMQEWIAGALVELGLGDPRKQQYERTREYREGKQPKRLVVKGGQTDDNLVVNFSGLVVDRTVSLLFGKGVRFDLPGEGITPADEYIQACWSANRQDELLNDIADFGATSGTPAVVFDIDGVEQDGKWYPGIMPLDPSYLTIETDPENYRNVKRYIIEYAIETDDGVRGRRRIIEPFMQVDEANEQGREIITAWIVMDYIENEHGRWVEMPGSPRTWEYKWAPVLAWKNLPNAGSVYGRPDLSDDVLHMQDGINFVASNINKVLRLQAHQRLWGRFLDGVKAVVMGPDSILNVPNEKGHIEAIPANASFVDMLEFQNALRDAMFSIARSTDPHALKDSVGQLTNFGLRILYKDALDKLETKRRLYGEALLEMNRRLLELGGFEPDAGEIVWNDPLPTNEQEQMLSDQFELEAGLVSRQTVRETRGYDNDTELERIAADQTEENRNNTNIGSLLLGNFTQGRE